MRWYEKLKYLSLSEFMLDGILRTGESVGGKAKSGMIGI